MIVSKIQSLKYFRKKPVEISQFYIINVVLLKIKNSDSVGVKTFNLKVRQNLLKLVRLWENSAPWELR